MTFSLINYANNELQKSPLNDFIKNIFEGYGDVYKARELPEELKKKQLENKWYEPNIESEIGLRGAHAGLLGEQTKGARIENEFARPKYQAQIDALKAKAQQTQLLQMIREKMLGGNLGGLQSAPQGSPMSMSNGQGMQSAQQGQSAPMQMPQQAQQPSSAGLDYAQAATAMQMLGLGKPQVVDVNGRYMAITPFGNVDTGLMGLSQRDTALAKEDAKKISALENIVLSGSQKQETFNELNNILGSAEFEALRANPVLGRHELAWYKNFGTRQQQDMIGQAQTHMGNIIKDSSRDFAGQFRVGEQALLNDMKPNQSDSIDVMRGKAEALTYMNQILTKRAEMEADLMRNYNMSALQAKVAADKQIDPKQIKKEIRTILHPASSTKITPEQARSELERRRTRSK